MACFDLSIDEALAKEIAADKPLRNVLSDGFLLNDDAKENVKHLLKQLNPETEMKVIWYSPSGKHRKVGAWKHHQMGATRIQARLESRGCYPFHVCLCQRPVLLVRRLNHNVHCRAG